MAIQLKTVDLSQFSYMWQQFVQFIPRLLLVISILIVAWIASKVLGFFLRRLLKIVKIERLNDKLNEIELLHNSNYNFDFGKIVVKILRWTVMLIAVVIVSDILGMDALTRGIGDFIGYLPKLLSALTIWILGILLANFIKNSIRTAFKSFNLSGSNLIGNILFFIIAVIISITALNQGGVNTEIITNNLTMILGSFLLAFTLAFGLGSKEIIQRLLFGFYSRKNLEVGQKIKIDDTVGIIESIDNINLVLKTGDGKLIYPIKKVNDEVVQILDK